MDEFHSPYTYVGGDPVNLVDPDGRQAYFAQGTFESPLDWTGSEMDRWTSALGQTGGGKVLPGSNQLKNTDRARRDHATALAATVLATRDGSSPVDLVGFSHGGNVAIMAANILQHHGVTVRNVITLATPVRDEYQLNDGAAETHIHVYDERALVQSLLGQFDVSSSSPVSVEAVLGLGRVPEHSGGQANTFNGAINRNITDQNGPPSLIDSLSGDIHGNVKNADPQSVLRND